MDFHHAAGHLAGFAKVFRTEPLADRLAGSWCHTLTHAGGRQVIRVLGRLDRTKMTGAVAGGVGVQEGDQPAAVPGRDGVGGVGVGSGGAPGGAVPQRRRRLGRVLGHCRVVVDLQM